MKLALTLALSTLILSATAFPSPTRTDSLGKRGGPPGQWNNQKGGSQQNSNSNNNNGGHDANWNGVYEQTPNCTPAAGVATDGNSYWADNCDDGAGEDGFGQ